MTPPAELTRHHPCPRGRHLLGVALALLAGLSLLVGCGGGGSDDSRTGTTRRRSTTSTSMSTDDDAATTTTLPLDATRVRLVDLDLDAKDPIDLAVRPGSRSLLIAERGGKIREAVQDTDGIGFAEEPVIDLTDAVGSTDMERGMLGIAVAPDGRHLYLSYTEKSHGDSRIDEYPLSGTDGELRADPAGRRQLVSIVQPFPNHNGGSLRFGPDRMLYAGFGDGGGAGDPNGNGQRRDTLLGKILRIDPEAPDGIPADNPFVTDGRATDGRATDGAEPLIWATGLRNPWRIDFDPATGDLWIGDVGQDRIEEIDRLTPSAGRPATAPTSDGTSSRATTASTDRPRHRERRARGRSSTRCSPTPTTRAARSPAASSSVTRGCPRSPARSCTATSVPAASGRCARPTTGPCSRSTCTSTSQASCRSDVDPTARST